MRTTLMNWVRGRIWLALVLLSLQHGGARFVEIAADIEEFSYPSGDTNSPVNAGQDFSVFCVTGTNQWRIDPGFRQTGASQWFFDGTNIYHNIIAIGGPRPIGISWKPGPGEILPAITNSSVHIRQSRDGCPQDDTQLNIPWLAFCSGTYLKRPGRIIPLPVVSSLRHTPDALAYSDKTQTFKDNLGLPRTVDLFASDALFGASVTNGIFAGKRDVGLWKRGSTGFKWVFPDGALRFHYAVTKSTNFLGWNFPVRFEWFLNNWEDGRAVTRCGGKGKVTSIRASARPVSVIVPGATNQNIVDWRFETGNNLFALMYTTTNAFALPTNDVVLQEKLAGKLNRAKR